MAAVTFPATAGPDGAGGLIQTATRGGVAVYAVTSAVPGNWFAVPQDEQRTYLCIALAPGSADVVVSPGNDCNGIGIPLTSSQPRVEFGGRAVDCLTKGQWTFSTDPAGTVHITTLRGVC